MENPLTSKDVNDHRLSSSCQAISCGGEYERVKTTYWKEWCQCNLWRATLAHFQWQQYSVLETIRPSVLLWLLLCFREAYRTDALMRLTCY